jgi:hypothetical protein
MKTISINCDLPTSKFTIGFKPVVRQWSPCCQDSALMASSIIPQCIIQCLTLENAQMFFAAWINSKALNVWNGNKTSPTIAYLLYLGLFHQRWTHVVSFWCFPSQNVFEVYACIVMHIEKCTKQDSYSSHGLCAFHFH